MEPLIPMVGVMALTAMTPSFDPMNYDREVLARLTAQAAIVAARAGADVTYESLHFDKRANTLTVLGLEARPPADAGAPDGCVFHVDRAAMRLDLTFDAATLRVEVQNARAAAACVEERDRADMPPPLAALGDDLLSLPHAALDIRYGFARSTLDMTLEAEAPAMGRFDASAQFDHLHVHRGRREQPGGNFLGAQATYAPSETVAALAPMILAQVAGGAPVEDLVDMALASLPGPARTGGKDEALLVASAKARLPQLVATGAPVTLVLTPRAPLDLTTIDEMGGPRDLIPALRPRFMAGPPLPRMIDSALLAQALEGAEPISDADRLSVGRALAVGVGAPRSAEAAAEVLAPLAAQGHAEAALLTAQALAARDPQRAYQAALTASLGGHVAAISLATTLEADMALQDILRIQQDAAQAYGVDRLDQTFEQAMQNPNPAQLRRFAAALNDGRAYPRLYEGAYVAALIAAAAGDRPAALLLEEMKARFSADPAWLDLVADAERAALSGWVRLEIGSRLSD